MANILGAMNPAGKPIHKLAAKLQILIEVLHDAGQLESRKFSALAEATGIKEKTLRNASYAGTVSLQVEQHLSNVGEFDLTDVSWCDTAVSGKVRGDIIENYPGQDTPDAFREMLQRHWHTGLIKYRAVSDCPTSVNREVACHELSDCGQGTTKDVDLPIFFEADFGPLDDHANGMRYGFEKARLRLDIICAFGSKTAARFGRNEPKAITKAVINSRGTDKQPSWEISCDPNSSGVLSGIVSTQDEPLMSLVDHGVGTRLSSTLSVNLYDARVIFNDGDEQHSPNKLAIIGHICAMQLAKNVDEHGRLDLSFHSLQIGEERR